MICLKYQNGDISGKRLSILMFQSKPKRLCSLAKATNIQKHSGINLDEKPQP